MIPAPPQPDRSNPNLAAALAAVGEQLPAERVDQVWVFPPRTRGARETGLAVLALFHQGPDDPRRTLLTVSYDAETVKGAVQRVDQVLEEGTVPRDRLDRLVDGIVRRLGGGMETPDIREVAGAAEPWSALLAELDAGG